MRAEIKTKTLKEALQSVKSAVRGKSTLEILKHVKMDFRASGNELYISSSCLDITIITRWDAYIYEGGDFCVEFASFNSFVGSLTGEEVELELDNGWLKLKCGKSKAKFATQPGEDFPAAPTIEASDNLILSATALARLSKLALFAADDQARANLCGVCLSATPTHLTGRTTDGHRAAQDMIQLDRAPSPAWHEDTLIDAKGIMSATDVMSDGEVTLTRDEDGQWVRFDQEDREVIVRTIVGKFPEFVNLVPRTYEVQATIPRKALATALSQVALLASKQTKTIKLKFAEGQLELSSSCPQKGNANVSIEASANSELQVGMNWIYLQQALSQIESEEVLLRGIDTLSPLILLDGEVMSPQFEGDQLGEAWLCLMPMRL